MTEEDYEEWLPAHLEEFAAGKVRAGNWPAEGAVERARQQMRELLPQGVATPGHLLFHIWDDARAKSVGSLWIKTGEPIQGNSVFIYNIEVHEVERGRGYGSATLTELIKQMTKAGAKNIALHVFAFNEAAYRLYVRHGFIVTNINMSKPLYQTISV